MIRDRLRSELKEAMLAKNACRLSTLRLIHAAIKDRDIAARSEDNVEGVGEDEIMKILGRMIRQREESAAAYEEGGRLELAEREREEIRVIRPFLPKPLSDADRQAAIRAAIDETGATSIRDMGKIMGVLKSKYTGKMDFGVAGKEVKDHLGA